MNTHLDKDTIEHIIVLLRSLIDLSPADSRNRLRLLKLLNANDRIDEFIIEAHQYRANCDLTFDTDWDFVCRMGREIDPKNKFFQKVPQKSRPQPNHQRSSGSGDATRKDTEQKAEPSSTQTSEQQPKQENPAREPRNDGSNRRNSVERRMEDRRISISAWFGEERRKYPQRQKRRRQADTSSHSIH